MIMHPDFIELTVIEYKSADDPLQKGKKISVVDGFMKRQVLYDSILLIEEDNKYGTFVSDFMRADGKKIGFFVKEKTEQIFNQMREAKKWRTKLKMADM